MNIKSFQSPEIYFAFDDLLLLQKGGKQIYFGPTNSALPYFESKSGISADDQNPAEYILTFSDSNNERDKINGMNWSKKWDNSSEAKMVTSRICALNEGRYFDENRQLGYNADCKNAGVATQCYELTKRVFRHFWRGLF